MKPSPAPPLPAKVAFGLWEWGTPRREAGFAK